MHATVTKLKLQSAAKIVRCIALAAVKQLNSLLSTHTGRFDSYFFHHPKYFYGNCAPKGQSIWKIVNSLVSNFASVLFDFDPREKLVKQTDAK